ncbi:MAG TPA: chromate transporter [Stellaceae bacterium]|jgi:chromate transporter|nr:chromate transporter [Stellaceae bacterium]
MSSSNEAAIDEFGVREDVSLLNIFVTFIRLGTMTFGGSVQSWVHREIVNRQRWLDDKTFLSGLGVALVLPGANPVNIALYVGLQLRGGLGAAAAVIGMLLPSFCLILLLGAFYREIGHLGIVHFILAGLAASGVGATLNMGIKVGRRLPRDVMTILVAVCVFVSSAILHWPMVPVVCVAVPVSIAWYYFIAKDSKAKDGKKETKNV